MEGFGFNSSQEPLLMSLDDALRDLLNAGGNEQFFREMYQAPVQRQTVRSSLPATSDWPGDYGFNVTFGQTNNIHWVYHEAERKLYIKRDKSCPINFSVSVPMLLPGAVVRAMAVYTSPEDANQTVHRCIEHSKKEIKENVFEAEHLIRSECRGAEYIQHEDSKRHSVTVPFENPPAGQGFSTYIYKFACLGSCSGGPNRRPITLLFTLEHNNVVLGRRSINLRICANPGRDSGATPKKAPTAKKIKTDFQQQELKENLLRICANFGRASGAVTKKAPVVKKVKADVQQQVTGTKRKIKEKETFAVTTRDPQCARFLEGVKLMYKITDNVGRLPREFLESLIEKIMSSSEDEFSSVEQ